MRRRGDSRRGAGAARHLLPAGDPLGPLGRPQSVHRVERRRHLHGRPVGRHQERHELLERHHRPYRPEPGRGDRTQPVRQRQQQRQPGRHHPRVRQHQCEQRADHPARLLGGGQQRGPGRCHERLGLLHLQPRQHRQECRHEQPCRGRRRLRLRDEHRGVFARHHVDLGRIGDRNQRERSRRPRRGRRHPHPGRRRQGRSWRRGRRHHPVAERGDDRRLRAVRDRHPALFGRRHERWWRRWHEREGRCRRNGRPGWRRADRQQRKLRCQRHERRPGGLPAVDRRRR